MSKNTFFVRILAVLSVIVLFSFDGCNTFDDTEPKGKPVEGDRIAYIINYGNYGGTKSEISIINLYSGKITNNAYKNANGIELNSNVQSAAIVNGVMYLMSNNGDKIDILDSGTLKAISNPISENITKPRYFVAKDTNIAYISCWGEVNDWTKLANSYLAKFDLKTNKATEIPIPGGPEGLIISNNKVFIALAAKNKIAVLNMDNESISYIDIPAIAQHFVKKHNGKLYASVVSKFSTPFPKDSLGIIEIDPVSNKVTDKIPVPNISNNGEIVLNSDKLYVITKEQYPGTKSEIYTIDIKTNEKSSVPLISGSSFTGLYVDGVVGKIFVLQSPSATVDGKVLIYNLIKEKFLSSKNTGIYPQQILAK